VSVPLLPIQKEWHGNLPHANGIYGYEWKMTHTYPTEFVKDHPDTAYSMLLFAEKRSAATKCRNLWFSHQFPDGRKNFAGLWAGNGTKREYG
jgi:hypothetical protein